MRQLKHNHLSLLVLFFFVFNYGNSAIGATEPLFPSTFVTASGANCNEIDLNWVSGDGARRLVVASANTPVSVAPVDGQSYSAATNFGSGSNLGNGNYVVYNSNGTNVTVSGLNGGTHYYFAVFEFNGTGIGSNYLTSVSATADTFATGITLSVIISDSSFCLGEFANLEAHGAPQYLWSPGAGLSSSTDSVIIASPTTTTQYTVEASDLNGCLISARFTLTVNSLPIVNLGNFSDICINGNAFTLSGGTPAGGTYSGPGVSSGIFNPAVAGAGIHYIRYSYTNAQGCSATDSSTIRVNSLPTVNLSSFLGTCVNSNSFTLTGGTPGGGFYSGAGVSAGIFSPSSAGVGTHSIIYTYTNVQGCTSSDTSSIVVNGLPVVSLSSFPSVCIDAASFALSGGSPSGGSYSGAGVSSGSFNPSVAGVGNQLITYSYTDGNGCSASALSSIFVNSLPSVTVGPLSGVCVNAPAFSLSGGTPTGGVYSGTGVSNDSVFSAAVADTGAHAIVYTYSDVNGCVNRDTADIQVFALPEVTLGTFAARCANTGPLSLSGGLPSGGHYSGPGVSGTTFYTGIAGAGTHTIIYTYTDSNTCSNSASSTIQVNPVPQPNLGPDTIACAETDVVLTAGNTYSTYVWSTGQNTASASIDSSGHGLNTFPVTLIVTNSFGCANRDTILVTFTPCAGVREPAISATDVVIYPNPTSSLFILETSSPVDIEIFDETGNCVEQRKTIYFRTTFGNSFSSGVYFVRVHNGNEIRTVKLLKQD